MTFTEQINQDMKEALKAGRKLELETLRTIRASILEFEKKGAGSILTKEDERALLSTAAKKRREAIEQYKLAGREELAEREAQELEIITKYLPKQLTESEMEALVLAVMEETGASEMKDFSKVVGPVMRAAKGKADGSAMQLIVRRLLGAS